MSTISSHSTMTAISTISSHSTMTAMSTISSHSTMTAITSSSNMTKPWSWFLELISTHSIHHSIRRPGLRHTKWTTINLIDKLPRIHQVESICVTKCFFAEPRIRRHFFISLKHILLTLQSRNQQIKHIIHCDLFGVVFFTLAHAHFFYGCNTNRSWHTHETETRINIAKG